MKEIQTVFNRSTSPFLSEVTLVFYPDKDGIPKQVLGNNTPLTITIDCNKYYSMASRLAVATLIFKTEFTPILCLKLHPFCF